MQSYDILCLFIKTKILPSLFFLRVFVTLSNCSTERIILGDYGKILIVLGAAIGMYLFLSYLPLSWNFCLWVPWNNKLGKIVGNVIAIDTFSNHMKLWKNEKIWQSHAHILMLISITLFTSFTYNLHQITLWKHEKIWQSHAHIVIFC